MRLFGLIALCLVLLASVIYGFDRRHEIKERLADSFVDLLPEEPASVDSALEDLPEPASAQQAVIPMREAGQLNAASGFPGYAKATFPLPRSATPVAGQITLDISGSMQVAGEGRFRVSVNGVRRKEVVLEPGRMRRKLVLPLNARELSSKDVTIALSVEGRTPDSECTRDWRGGAVVQILPSSHMRLDLVAPLSDPADLLLTAGAPLTFDWPAASDASERAALLQLAYRLETLKHDVLFATRPGQGLSLDRAALDALNTRKLNLPSARPDPRDLAAALDSRRSLSFEAEAQWRLPFDRRHLEGGAVGSLDLALAYDTAGSEAGWLMSVFLNNRLVHSEELASASGQVERLVELPYAEQAQLNEIQVKLTSAEGLSGHCVRARPAVAEITRATLTADGRIVSTPANEAQALFDTVQRQRIAQVESSPSLDALGAQVALDTFVSLFPNESLLLPGLGDDMRPGARVIAVAQADLEQALVDLAAETGWAVFANPEHPDGHTVTRLSDMAGTGMAALPRAVLIVVSDAADDSGVATQ